MDTSLRSITAETFAKWAVSLTYLRLLIGAIRAFKPIERNGGGLPLFLTFAVMIYTSGRTELSRTLAIPGMILLAGALALFQWAAHSIRGRLFTYIGSHDTPQFVHQSGPYAYIRHPFYACYLMANTGVALMFPSWITLVTAIATFAILWRAAAFEEGKFAHSPSAADYRDYMARTGRFLPKL